MSMSAAKEAGIRRVGTAEEELLAEEVVVAVWEEEREDCERAESPFRTRKDRRLDARRFLPSIEGFRLHVDHLVTGKLRY